MLAFLSLFIEKMVNLFVSEKFNGLSTRNKILMVSLLIFGFIFAYGSIKAIDVYSKVILNEVIREEEIKAPEIIRYCTEICSHSGYRIVLDDVETNRDD